MAKKKIKHGRAGGRLPTVERGGKLEEAAQGAGIEGTVQPVDAPKPEAYAQPFVHESSGTLDPDREEELFPSVGGTRLGLTESGRSKQKEFVDAHAAAQTAYREHRLSHPGTVQKGNANKVMFVGDTCPTCDDLKSKMDTAFSSLDHFRRNTTGDKALKRFEKTGEVSGTKVPEEELSDESVLQKHVANMKTAAAAGNHVEADQHKVAALMVAHLSGLGAIPSVDPDTWVGRDDSTGRAAVELPCSTTNCHGTHFNDTTGGSSEGGAAGLCQDCADHEAENGWGSAETRLPRKPGSNTFAKLEEGLGKNPRQTPWLEKLQGAFKTDTITPAAEDDWLK